MTLAFCLAIGFCKLNVLAAMAAISGCSTFEARIAWYVLVKSGFGSSFFKLRVRNFSSLSASLCSALDLVDNWGSFPLDLFRNDFIWQARICNYWKCTVALFVVNCVQVVADVFLPPFTSFHPFSPTISVFSYSKKWGYFH